MTMYPSEVEDLGREHGEERRLGERTREFGQTELVNDAGEVVWSGPTASVTETVFEKWCAKCLRWSTFGGVIGALRSMCSGCLHCGAEWDS